MRSAIHAWTAASDQGGEFDMARTLYIDAHAASKEHGDPGYLDEIARMAMALSSPADAARIADGADALRHAFGLKVWPRQRERIHDYRKRCRDVLGGAAYEAVYEVGRALDPDGVVSMTRAWLSSSMPPIAAS